jgi:RNA polymerase sigma-70 factor, ECF subfamily
MGQSDSFGSPETLNLAAEAMNGSERMTETSTPQCTPHIIIRAQQGDSQAIGEIYECYRVSIFRYLYYRTGDGQTADDLTSEVFLRMIRSLGSYRKQEVAFLAWLFQIAHNLLTDYYRKKRYRNHLELEDQEMVMQEPGSHTTGDARLNSLALRQALERLNEEQRDVIVMRFVTGMPIAEVAQALNKSEDAVKGLQRRGLAALRDVLSDWEVQYAA